MNIPYGKQSIRDKDIKNVIKVLKSQYITQGPKIEEFESKITAIVESNYGIVVNSATSALHLACIALDLSKNDYLWTSPISFVASANCGRYCGAKIDFVDIDPDSGLMSIPALISKLKEAKINGKLPKIVIPVHLGGTSCDMEKIWNLSKEYGFKIIEDASHAIGGKYKNEPVGSCRFSSICVFSFHPVKIITTGEGGAAVSNNSILIEKMKLLRSHGITKESSNFEYPNKGSWYYEQKLLGFNYRISDIQCALGISQLQRLKEIVLKRNKIFDNYKEMVKKLPVDLLTTPENCYSARHLAVISLRKSHKKYYFKIFEEMRSAGIGIQLHYLPIHLQPYYRKLGFKEGNFPNAENYSKTCFSIPLYEDLKKSDQKKVIQTLAKLLK